MEEIKKMHKNLILYNMKLANMSTLCHPFMYNLLYHIVLNRCVTQMCVHMLYLAKIYVPYFKKRPISNKLAYMAHIYSYVTNISWI